MFNSKLYVQYFWYIYGIVLYILLYIQLQDGF